MISPSNPTNSSALQYNYSVADRISVLCEPLFNNFNITVFGYTHFFNNGTYIDLCTNIEWQNHFIEYFASDLFISEYMTGIFKNGTRYVMWDNDITHIKDKTHKDFIVDSCRFDIWHGFTIYKHFENTVEAWHFATTKDNNRIFNFYLNYLDLLEHFIRYFREKASDILDPSDKQKLIALQDNSFALAALSDIPHDIISLGEKIKEFMKETNINRYCINTKKNVVCLSPREVECLLHLSKNKTTKETAKLLNLSPRTIDAYIENIKKKLDCKRRSQLIEIFLESFNTTYMKIF